MKQEALGGEKTLFLSVQLQAFSSLGQAQYNQACTNNQLKEIEFTWQATQVGNNI